MSKTALRDRVFEVTHQGIRIPGRVGVPMALALAAFLAGPRVQVDDALTPVAPPSDVEAFLSASESGIPGIREGDEKQVVWADTARPGPTDVAVVYLHGFSADHHEMAPVPQRLAAALGANLYLTRLTGHGRDGEALAGVKVEDWFADVVEAIAVARSLGRRVVLMGTSTGGTLAVWAAAQSSLEESIAALVLVSPNFHPRDRGSRVLLLPWGEQIARLALGRERCFDPVNEGQARHWTTCYPVSALLPMMALVERVRTTDLSTVEVPTFVAYSPDDQVVDPADTERFIPTLGSDMTRMYVVEASSDPARHVLAGDILSPNTTEPLVAEIVDFLREAGIGPARGGGS